MEQGLIRFTEALSSTAPTPGGGGAAALMGALAASLGRMASQLSVGKKTEPGRLERLREIAERCETLRRSFLEQIDADEAAFLPLSQAYRLPKETPGWAETLRRASLDACAAAEEMLRLCAKTAALLTRLREQVSPLLLSDVGCAAAACRAALLCAAMNVYVNTRGYPGDAEAQRLDSAAERALLESLPQLEDVELRVLMQLRDDKHE